MCFGGGAPSAPPAPTPPPEAPIVASEAVKGASASQLLQARAAAGLSSTILTGASGLALPATDAPKTLLGA